MTPKAIALLLYYLVIFVASMAMITGGIRASEWRYWVILVCLIVAHITGNSY